MSTLTLNLSEKLVKDIIESDASLKAEIDAWSSTRREEFPHQGYRKAR